MICTTDEFSELKSGLDVKGVTNVIERQKLIAEINAVSCKIYGINEKELKLVLKTFPIVDEKLKIMTLDEFDLLK